MNFNCLNDEVFVLVPVCTYYNDKKVSSQTLNIKRKKDLSPNDKIVQCVVCGEPASFVDQAYPRETHDCRCNKHRYTLIDEDAYENYGLAIPVCEEHWEFSVLKVKMDTILDFLSKEGDKGPLMSKLKECRKLLVEYDVKKWPKEQMGPVKDS